MVYPSHAAVLNDCVRSGLIHAGALARAHGRESKPRREAGGAANVSASAMISASAVERSAGRFKFPEEKTPLLLNGMLVKPIQYSPYDLFSSLDTCPCFLGS
jgi:hypothetical protein